MASAPAPQWKANSTVVEGVGTVTPVFAATINPDDLVLYFIQTANQAPATPPASFTACPNSPQGTGTGGSAGSTAIYAYYRFGPGAIDATSDSGDHQLAFAQLWTGVDRVNPFGTGAGGADSSSITTVTIPGCTTAKNNSQILCIAANAIDTDTDTQYTFVSDGLTNTTSHFNVNTAQGVGGGIWITGGDLPTAGATGDTVGTLGSASKQAYLTLDLQARQITFVGSTSGADVAGATSGNTTISLTGLTGGSGTTALAGDLVIAIYSTGSTADRTLAITDGSSNYTLIGSEAYTNSGVDTNLRVAYKFMGGTPDTTTTFGPTGNAQDAGCQAVFVFRNVDATTPLDVAVVAASATNTGRPDPASITPTTPGAMLLIVGAAAAATGAVFTTTDLGNFITNTSADNNDSMLGVGTSAGVASVAFNPAQFGGGTTGATDSTASISIALRPAHPTCEPADTDHAHAADASTIIAKAPVAATDATHAHAADASTIIAKAPVEPEDATHGHTADACTVTPNAPVITAEPDDATHAHTADASTVIAHAVAAPTDATHGHTADSVTITAHVIVLPADALHGHTADAASVSEHSLAEPDDATHGHTADASTITAHAIAAPADATHAHTADAVTLSEHALVEPTDATHAHTADSATITAHAVCEPTDATHAHTADACTLTTHMGAVCYPDGATHGHTADACTVTAHVGEAEQTKPGGGNWSKQTDWKPGKFPIYGRFRTTEEPDTARFTGDVFTAVLKFEKPIGKFVAVEEADGMAATGFMLDLVADDNDFLMMA